MNDVISTLPGTSTIPLDSTDAKASVPTADTRSEFDVEINGTVGKPFVDNPKMTSRNCDVFYADKQAIFGVDLDIGNNEIIAMIGPSGCGKSTYLRVLNRMNDTIPICRVTGEHTLVGEDIYAKKQDPVLLRARVGMVFQKPNPFPKSIYDNVAYGARLHGLADNRSDLDEVVESSLIKAGLFKEVKDDLQKPGTGLSGGQQQRLCIARAIAVDPEVILMDELKENYTIAIVTHSMQQAARVSQRTAYFHMGKLVEVNETGKVFTNPEHQLTENYITGRFG